MSGLLPLPSDLPDHVGPLTRNESAALAVCEAVIEENLGAWVNVTNAFLEIAEHGLYRETHSTFEAYCADKWGISRSQGHRLVLLGRVGMSPVGDKIRNERQAREVASLLDNPELLLAVVAKAEEIRAGKPLTAAALRQARAELTLPPDQAAEARRVYELAEWTQEAVYEWEKRAVKAAERQVAALPASEWGWGFAQIQDRPTTPEEGLTMLAKQLALDAPLTDDVCNIIRQAQGEVVGFFTAMMDGFSAVASAVSGLESIPDGGPVNEVGRMMRQAFMVAVTELSTRMAVVLIALSEAEPLDREWTPEEIEQAKAAWSARVVEMREKGEITLWPPGPLGDSLKALESQGRSVATSIGDVIRQAEAEAAKRKSA